MNKRPTCLQLPHNALAYDALLGPAGFRRVSCAQKYYLGPLGAVFDSTFIKTSLKLQRGFVSNYYRQITCFYLT